MEGTVSPIEGGLKVKGEFHKTPSRERPLVSIITVVYNGEAFLEKTMQSVLSQTYDNIEYIVVDGNSTDGTLAIIQQYEDQVDYWRSEPDTGLYDAMNKGIRLATGDYLWFMNAGDEIESTTILEQMMSQTNYADVIYGEANLIDPQGKILGTRTELTTRKLPVQLSWVDMGKGMVVCHQAMLVKRDMAPAYDLEYYCSADIDWTTKVLKRAATVLNMNKVVCRYMTEGISERKRKKCWQERFKITLKHFGFFGAVYYSFYILLRAIRYKLSG